MKKQDYGNARSLFKGFDYQIIVRAAIEGSSPCKIWIDDVVHPECGFMATTEGWFLAGNPNKNEFNQGLRELVHNMILRGDFYSPVNPEFLSYLFFHIDTDEWRSKFSLIFDIRPPLPTHRIHFACDRVVLDWKDKIPEGYRLLQVDSTLNVDSLEFPEDIREWVAHSLDDQKKRGFGKCLIHGNKVVVWINSDCASGDECEIGIITTEDYRMKGLGAITAAAAVDYCLSNGYTIVGWHCENHNFGSIGVARKVGFVKERDYVHYICMFSEAEHFAESGMRYFLSREYERAISDFEKAFLIGEVPVWSYYLATRSYGAVGDANGVLRYMIEAKNRGWTNWDPILQDEKMRSALTLEEWTEITSQIG